MPKKHLTDITIRSLPIPATGQQTYWCDQLRSFGVRVSRGGAKTFVIKRDNRRRTIGRYPDKSLQKARSEARDLLRQRAPAPTITFGELVEHFFAIRCTPERNRERTINSYRRLLEKHFLPALRKRRLDEITRADLTAIIGGLLRSGTPAEANHAHVAARVVLRFGVAEQLLERNPTEGMQLPARRRARSRVLADEELALVFASAGQAGFPFGLIVQLLISLGQRRGEIGALRWTYIDKELKTINFPSSLTKNGREHTFPYGELTASLLDRVASENDHLFESPTRLGTLFGGWAKEKVALDCKCPIAHWTLHDLRRTFSTIHARIGTPPHITERLLNHQVGTLTPIAKIYNRYSYMDEMREAMFNYEQDLLRIFSLQRT